MNADDQPFHGIKRLDAQNWLEPDQASRRFVSLTAEGHVTRMEGEEWTRVFLEPRLSSQCPRDVIVAFETARGALLYGCFFYPLYALGRRELLHAAELAVRHRCLQLDLPKRKTDTFNDQTSTLRDAGELTAEEAKSWTRLRKMRNELVHSGTATISMPGTAARTLRRTADLTNALFA